MLATKLGPGSAALASALLLGAVASIGLMAVERDRLRRLLLGLIDPRPLALLRICFGLCLLLGALEVAPLNLYLFSDEGLLPSPAVAQIHGTAALAGDGPAGSLHTWPKSQVPDPRLSCGCCSRSGLAGAVTAWAREDRRRHAASVAGPFD